MAAILSKGVRISTIVVGFSLLALAAAAIVCGGIALSKLDNDGAMSVGLWAVYFLIPAVLCLVAGFGSFTAFAVALVTNIVGILLALSGIAYAAVIWAILNATCISTTTSERCSCVLDSEKYNFDASCSDLETIRDANAALTIIYFFLFMVSVVGAILGCAGACCCKHVQERHTIRARYYDTPDYPERMKMSKHRDRHFYPYAEEARHVPEGRYVQERVYNHGGPFVQLDRPYVEERRYIEERPYMEERRYVEERPYREDRRYTEERRRREDLENFEGGRYNNAYHEQPSYSSFHKQARDEAHTFAGHTTEAAEDTTK